MTTPLVMPSWFQKEDWERNTRYLRQIDRRNHLLGRLLLIHALEELGYSIDLIRIIGYSTERRPSLDIPWDFNISHCDDLVAVALGERSRIGLDVEDIHTIDIEDFRSCFTPHEWEDILASKNRYQRFFYYWTRKEAVLKAIGSGLLIHPSSFEALHDTVIMDMKTWYLHAIDLGRNHACFMATNDPEPEIIIREIDDPFKQI